MKARLFGTDGIRGRANSFPMRPDIILKVGQALGLLLRTRPSLNKAPKVVIGKDTRLSGYMVELALTSGLNSMGVHVQLVGPLPTPGIGFLTRNMRADAGIVISASHNPFHDNGIKIFDHEGYKIPDEMELELERLVFNEDLNELLASSTELGRSRRIDDSQGRYIVFCKATFPMEYTLEGMRIVLDCSNGAAYKVAPAVFEELGAEVILTGNQPNGFNINHKVGATHPSNLSELVLQYRADVGISLDGDGDRSVLVDENGKVVNGDHILCMCALHLKSRGKLAKNTVVATQMSNFGLDKALKSAGIKVIRTQVGDKYVVDEMRKHGYALGGEQSGHVIFSEHSTTGDGIIAALNVLAVMKESGKALSELNSQMQDVPQVLINTKVKRRMALEEIEGYEQMEKKVIEKLNGEGRIFVRFSGTEDVIRVLVEGPDRQAISEYAEEVASFLESRLSV